MQRSYTIVMVTPLPVRLIISRVSTLVPQLTQLLSSGRLERSTPRTLLFRAKTFYAAGDVSSRRNEPSAASISQCLLLMWCPGVGGPGHQQACLFSFFGKASKPLLRRDAASKDLCCLDAQRFLTVTATSLQ